MRSKFLKKVNRYKIEQNMPNDILVLFYTEKIAVIKIK